MTYYNYLASFLSVYRTRSFSKAAKALKISQSAVTNHVSNLESKFKKTLFDRHSRKVEPTPFAHQMATMISPHLNELDKLLGLQQQSDTQTEVTINLGGPAEMIEVFILSKLAQLVKDQYKFKIHLGDATNMPSNLEKGIVDFIIGLNLFNQNVESIHLGELTGEIFAGKKSPQNFETP
jgi:DNA-binding transcriptional LysR family regulator